VSDLPRGATVRSDAGLYGYERALRRTGLVHIAGADEARIQALRSYGLNLGLAFQLVDDALDYGGASDKLGKNAGDEPYWLKIIDLLRDTTLEETLNDAEVKKRCQMIRDEQEKLRQLLLERTTMKGNVIYCDLRGIKEIPDGNRFLIFTLFPKGNIQVKVAHDSQRENTTAISVGYNIFNPTSNVNVGELLKNYGGGGHKVVGSSRVPHDKAEQAIKEIVEAVTEKA